MNYFLLAAAICIAGYALIRVASARRAEAIEENQRDSYRRRIAQDPANIGAYEALADSLRRAGRLDEARDAYQQALDVGSGDLVLDTTRYKLQQTEAEIRERAQGGRAAPAARELEFCRRCGGANPPQRRHCVECGNVLPLPSYWEALKDREVQRSSIEAACMFTIVIVLMRVLYFMPLEIKGVILMSTVIVVGWWVLRSIEGRRG